MISVQPTPNPNAFKFVCDQKVKNEGSSLYREAGECGENALAFELFKIRGIDQLYFFDNTITVTKFEYGDWEEVEEKITEVLNAFLPHHNPDYHDPDPEAERRRGLSPDLQAIEEILDKTIRPGLQADGGDIATLTYENDILLVRYAGACGTCPSSTTGTLEAIKSILREQFNENIEVYIAPDY